MKQLKLFENPPGEMTILPEYREYSRKILKDAKIRRDFNPIWDEDVDVNEVYKRLMERLNNDPWWLKLLKEKAPLRLITRGYRK